MIPPCLICAQAAVAKHHLTARDHRERYLDPRLTGPLCHDHHEFVGDDEYTLADGHVVDTSTGLGRLEVRLTRLAVFLGTLADSPVLAGLPVPLARFLADLARHLAAWAGELAQSIQLLDRYQPGWRTIPGI
jgi:hypothetical protein